MLGNKTARLRRRLHGAVEPLHLGVVNRRVRRLAFFEDVAEKLLQTHVVGYLEAQVPDPEHIKLLVAADFDSANERDSFEQCFDFGFEAADAGLMVTKHEVDVRVDERLDVVRALVRFPRIAEGQCRTELPGSLENTGMAVLMFQVKKTIVEPSNSLYDPAQQAPFQARTGDERDPNQ